jgi:hypothetical protein
MFAPLHAKAERRTSAFDFNGTNTDLGTKLPLAESQELRTPEGPNVPSGAPTRSYQL